MESFNLNQKQYAIAVNTSGRMQFTSIKIETLEFSKPYIIISQNIENILNLFNLNKDEKTIIKKQTVEKQPDFYVKTFNFITPSKESIEQYSTFVFNIINLYNAYYETEPSDLKRNIDINLSWFSFINEYEDYSLIFQINPNKLSLDFINSSDCSMNKQGDNLLINAFQSIHFENDIKRMNEKTIQTMIYNVYANVYNIISNLTSYYLTSDKLNNFVNATAEYKMAYMKKYRNYLLNVFFDKPSEHHNLAFNENNIINVKNLINKIQYDQTFNSIETQRNKLNLNTNRNMTGMTISLRRIQSDTYDHYKQTSTNVLEGIFGSFDKAGGKNKVKYINTKTLKEKW